MSETKSKHRTAEIYMNGILSACAEFDGSYVSKYKEGNKGKLPTTST
jgi:hypothetical protein